MLVKHSLLRRPPIAPSLSAAQKCALASKYPAPATRSRRINGNWHNSLVYTFAPARANQQVRERERCPQQVPEPPITPSITPRQTSRLLLLLAGLNCSRISRTRRHQKLERARPLAQEPLSQPNYKVLSHSLFRTRICTHNSLSERTTSLHCPLMNCSLVRLEVLERFFAAGGNGRAAQEQQNVRFGWNFFTA